MKLPAYRFLKGARPSRAQKASGTSLTRSGGGRRCCKVIMLTTNETLLWLPPNNNPCQFSLPDY